MQRKRIATVAMALVLGTMVGCTRADQASWASLGRPHHIKQFSGGVLIGEWDSTGKVANEANSDGYRFQDALFGKEVRVSGTVQITVN